MEIDENAPGNQSQQAVTRSTDNETVHDPRPEDSAVPLPPNDEAPVDEDMTDVAATNSVSAEHPEAGSGASAPVSVKTGTTDVQDGDVKEPRGIPASDPESGA
jgi:cell division protein FtsI/penicillin-binding protein 2